MKSILRRGDYASLNVYFLSGLAKNAGILGDGQYPDRPFEEGSDFFITDGCKVDANTMPGGKDKLTNQGKTATHEIGHWMGLYHVFEGESCDGLGDQVKDTPP